MNMNMDVNIHNDYIQQQYIEFLKLNRNEMYTFISDLYFKLNDTKNAYLIIQCCNKFLALFQTKPYTFNDSKISYDDLKQTFLIKFFLAMSYQTINDLEYTIMVYEEILSDNRCPDDIKSWCLHNVKLIYQKVNIDSQEKFVIPRIIHVLFFGMTPFEYHHYRCLKSMLNHMCDFDRDEQNRYQLYIHTVFDSKTNEPILINTNAYWDEITNHPSVHLIPATVPEEIDGFTLKYFQYKADLYRIDVLYKYGGIYLDADLLLIKPLDDIFKEEEGKYSFYICEENPPSSKEDEKFVINAFIASTPNNPVLELWKQSIPSRIRNHKWAYHIRANEAIWRDYPFRIFKYGINVLPNTLFFDYSWKDSSLWNCERKADIKSEHYGYHLWETILNPIISKNIFIPSSEYRHNQKVPIDSLFDKVIILTTSDSKEKLNYTMIELLLTANIPESKIHIITSERNSKFPVIGCREAHINAIKFAKENDYSSVLIVEDDIQFNGGQVPHRHHTTPTNNDNNIQLDIIDKLVETHSIHKPPLDWDILYLGGILTSYDSWYYSNTNEFNNQRTTISNNNNNNPKLSDWIKGTIWCNHAYIVRKHIYNPILETYEKFLKVLSSVKPTENIDELAPFANIDHFYTHTIQNKYKCYLNNHQEVIQLPDLNNGKWIINEKFNWDTFGLKYILPDNGTDEFDKLNIDWNNF